MQIKYFITSISYQVPSWDKVFPSTQTRPIYTIGMYRDKGPFKFLFLVYFVLYNVICLFFLIISCYYYYYYLNFKKPISLVWF